MAIKFINQLQAISRMQFTGRLNVQLINKQAYRFYYHVGRLVWASGGFHQVRRWRRYLSQFCPDVDINALQRWESVTAQEWEYRVLGILLRQQQITREQAIAFIATMMTEVAFDVLQEAQVQDLTFSASQQGRLESPVAVINPQQVIDKVQATFKSWSDLGLMFRSPNLAPVIAQPDELRQRISPKAYQMMVTAMNGELTLRELAVQARQDLLTLAAFLSPYIQKELLNLVEVPDLPRSTLLHQTASSGQQPTPKPRGPKIVCVDDSINVCKAVESILTQAGYQCASVQDSLQALTTLLEHKPSLILLDLVMPIANGYEICTQIRRISAFKYTPIVILTGNDGIVDRVRAKIVGASDFLTKPVDAKKLLSVVQKHLTASSSEAIARELQV